MKWKSILPVLIVFAGIAGLIAASDEEFLPFLRYRHITDWSPIVVTYTVEVVHAQDETYRLIVSTCAAKKRVLHPWLGDSVKVIKYEDGFRIIEADRDVSGFDSAIVSFSGNQVIPRKEGTTQAIVKLPNNNEIVQLEVVREDWGLAVYGKAVKSVAG